MKSQLAAAFVFALALSACSHPPQPVKERTDLPSARNTPVGVGEQAPEFTLEDQSHQKVTLSLARGERPVVLVFYRGYW
jgi:cytochrome oxidase Cu insertion factor (SCO1/SenC/PrrC family)